MSKKLIAMIIVCILVIPLSACGESASGFPGTGTKGVVEKIDWSGYDELLDKTMSETNLEKRALMLHEAEEMLIDSGALGPITSSNDYMLVKPGITGSEFVNNGNIDVTHVSDANGTDSFGVCICTEVSKMDPPANTTSDISNILQNTYARLMKKDGDGNILPELAESYTISDDGLTYEFVIRDGLKWSDGSEFNAKDFEYSWKRGAASENAFEYKDMFDCIKGFPDDLDVKASHDGKILTVRMENPTAYFLELTTHSSYTPVQQKQVEAAAGYKDASGKLLNPSAWATDGPIVTNGAYYVDEWVHNERIVLKKNPYYYDAGNINADKITMMLTSDSAAAYSAYLSDSISVLHGLVPSDVLPTLKDSPEYHVCQKLSTRNIIFNVTSSLFEGMTAEEAKTFRKAIITAIDRQFIIDVVSSGNTTVCGTYVPMGMSVGTGKKFSETEGYSYPEETGYYKAQPDLDKAREMLRSIGFEFGNDGKLKNPITIEYLYSSSTVNEALAVALQADLAQLGINLSLSSREWAVFLGEESSGNYEMAVTTWNADYDDPYNFLALYISDSANNRAFLGH